MFLIDESHLLHQNTLDHLHILLNYAWDSRALLSLILVGLPELRERLALRRNRSLYSRINHRLEINALTSDDTTDYLRMRMERAGCTREVFAGDAIVLLHEATVGGDARPRPSRRRRAPTDDPQEAQALGARVSFSKSLCGTGEAGLAPTSPSGNAMASRSVGRAVPLQLDASSNPFRTERNSSIPIAASVSHGDRGLDPLTVAVVKDAS